MFNDFDNGNNISNSSSFESDYFFLKNSPLSNSNRLNDLGFNRSNYYCDDNYYHFRSNRQHCFSINIFGFGIIYDFKNKVWSLNFSFVGFIISIVVLVVFLAHVFNF